MRKIRFQGREWLLTDGMAITTEEAYAHGTVSYAHLIDGVVMRFGKKIGTDADIEDLGPLDHEVKIDFVDGIMNMLIDPASGGWFKK